MKISLTDCTCDELLRLSERCGFIVFHGKRHEKIKNANGEFITTIPRHNKLNKNTVKSILKRLKDNGCDVEW